MKDDALEVLLVFVGEYWEENRHIEEQRVAISNIIIIVASAAIGLIAQKEISISRLPLALLIAFAGLYGILATAKLYERYRFLQTRLDLFYEKIDLLQPDATFEDLRKKALQQHRRNFRVLARLPLNMLWMAIHAVLLVLGLVLTFQTL